MDLEADFDTNGFLGEGVISNVGLLRAENAEWFKLAEDCNGALMRAAVIGMGLAKTNSLDPTAVAVRILMRSCGNFQAVLLLAERGMISESRTLARNLLENAFAIAALHEKPDQFTEMMKEDHNAGRRLQAKYILAKRLVTDPANEGKLRSMFDSMGKEKHMTPKAIADLGPLSTHYLAYQRLSDDSAHVSASSLEKHIWRNRDNSGWMYKWGPGDATENAATLYDAILAVIPIGIGATAMLQDDDGNHEFAGLLNEFNAMPITATI